MLMMERILGRCVMRMMPRVAQTVMIAICSLLIVKYTYNGADYKYHEYDHDYDRVSMLVARHVTRNELRTASRDAQRAS